MLNPTPLTRNSGLRSVSRPCAAAWKLSPDREPGPSWAKRSYAPVTAPERHSASHLLQPRRDTVPLACYSLGETQCLSPVTASERHSASRRYSSERHSASRLLQLGETQCLAPVTALERHSASSLLQLGETQCLAPVTASERHSAHTCYNLRETQCSHLLQPRRDTVPHTCLGQVVHFEKYREAPSGLPLRAPWCRIL